MKFDVGQIDKTNGISYHEINTNSVSFLYIGDRNKCQE